MRRVDKFLSAAGLAQCPACAAHTTGAGLCARCVAGLQANLRCCSRCALPLPKTAICLECQHQPPPWSHCHAPWVYNAPLSTWLHRAKFHEDLVAVGVVCELLINQPLPPSDIICPIPMPGPRLRKRGINVAAELARALSHKSKRPLTHALHSTEHARQSLQNRKGRLQIDRKHFRTTQALQGQRVLLIDDVMTTGATLRAACLELQKGGAREVSVMALLRTPHSRCHTPA